MDPKQTVQVAGRVRTAAGALAVMAWAGLALSLGQSVTTSLHETLRGMFVFSGYFTIWTNIAVALALSVPLLAPTSRPGRFVRRPGVVTGIAASIALVAIAYEVLLRQTWDPLGVALVADLLVHYLVPVGFIGYWWLVTPKTTLGWRAPVVWLWYPAAYAAVALVRGAATGHYPYPFLDAATLGYGQVLVNIAGLGIGFLVLSWLLVGIGRLERHLRSAA